MWALDLVLSLSVPALALAGLPAVRAFARQARAPIDGATTAAAALALGLAWAQAGGMLLGFTGLLRPAAVAAWLVLGVAGGAGALLWRRAPPGPGTDGDPTPPLRELLRRLTWPSPATLAGVALVALQLLLATVPPWYRDSMIYHLALPRSFAQAGGYVVPDDNLFASFPLGWESILALLHALGSAPDRFPPFNPRLAGAWTCAAAALATTGLAREAGAPARLAPWAGVLFLLVPTVVEFGPSAYVEPYLLLLLVLALAAVLRAARGEPGAAVVAALFAGLAASVKYSGLVGCAVLLALLLASGVGRGREGAVRAARAAATFTALAALVGAPFYVRNWLQRDNPVFPLFFELFGGRGWDSWRSTAYAVTLQNYGLGREPLDWVLLPVRLFTARDLAHGFEGSVGPVLALGGFAGLALLRRREDRGPAALLLGFAGLWAVAWALTVQQVRFFLAALPPLAALVAVLAGRWSQDGRPVLARAGRVLLPALAAAQALWAAPLVARLWDRQSTGAWLAGAAGRDELLARLLPESYPIQRELEALVPADGRVWLAWMRGHVYYLRRPYRVDEVFEAYRLEALLDEAATPGTFHAALRRDGITHLLVHHRFFLVDGNAELAPGRTDRLRARFQALVASGTLTAVRSWGPVTLYAAGRSLDPPPAPPG